MREHQIEAGQKPKNVSRHIQERVKQPSPPEYNPSGGNERQSPQSNGRKADASSRTTTSQNDADDGNDND